MPGPDDKALSDLEHALTRLRPSPDGFDRDRLMFESGRAAARRRQRLWRAATGFMTTVAAGLAAILLLRADPAPVVRVVYTERPAPDPLPQPQPAPWEAPPTPWPEPDAGASPAAALSYGRLQEFVARYGVDELPEPMPFSGEQAPTGRPEPPVLSAWQWHSRPASSWFNEGVE